MCLYCIFMYKTFRAELSCRAGRGGAALNKKLKKNMKIQFSISNIHVPPPPPRFLAFFTPFFFLFQIRRTSKRTNRGVLLRLPAFSYQLESLPGKIDLAFPNIDAPGVYLHRPLSALCRWYLAGVLSGVGSIGTACRRGRLQSGVVLLRSRAASHLLSLLLFFCVPVCVFFRLLFSQIGGFLAAPMHPSNHDTSSSQPARTPRTLQHDGRRLTITVQRLQRKKHRG